MQVQLDERQDSSEISSNWLIFLLQIHWAKIMNITIIKSAERLSALPRGGQARDYS